MDDKTWRMLDPVHHRVLKIPDSALVHAAPRVVEIDIATFQLFRSSVAMNVTNLVKFLSKVCKTNICSDAMGSLNVNGANLWFSRIVVKLPPDHAINDWAKLVFGARALDEVTLPEANNSRAIYLGQDFLWLWSPNKMRHTAEVRTTNRNKCQCASCAVRFNQAFDNFPPCMIDETMDAGALPSLIPGAEELASSETKPHELVYLLLATDVYGQFSHDAKRCPVTFDSGTHPNWIRTAAMATDAAQAANLERVQKVSHMLNVSLLDAGNTILEYHAARRGLPLSNELTHRCCKLLTKSADAMGVDPGVWASDDLDSEERGIMHRVANTPYFATQYLERYVDKQPSRPRAVPSALLRDAEGQRNPHISSTPASIVETGSDVPAVAKGYRDWLAPTPSAQPSDQPSVQPPVQPARRRRRLAHSTRCPTAGDGGLWLPPELWEVIFGTVADDALTNPCDKSFHTDALQLAEISKLARNTLYNRAAVMLTPAINAVAAFGDIETATTNPTQNVYDFLGCCDSLRLSLVSMMNLCIPTTVQWLKNPENSAASAWFRELHKARSRRVEALQSNARVAARRGNLGRPEIMEITTNHRNSLLTVSLARKPRVFHVQLDADPAHVPKTHALLHNLEHELLV